MVPHRFPGTPLRQEASVGTLRTGWGRTRGALRDPMVLVPSPLWQRGCGGGPQVGRVAGGTVWDPQPHRGVRLT